MIVAQAAGSKRFGSTGGLAVAATIFEILVATDGRQCKFCGCRDHDEDPGDKVLRIFRSDGKPMSMAWFTGQQKHGQKNEGMACFYCYSVFNSLYKHQKLTYTKVCEMIGVDSDGKIRVHGQAPGLRGILYLS